MAGSVNSVTILGNLGADPEVKSFQNGGRIANLRIATFESWKDKATGEKKERVEWHSVSIQSDGLVGVAERFLRKGSKVYVEGQLRTRKWADQSGNDRYTTEVVLSGPRAVLTMLDGAKGDGGRSSSNDGWGGSTHSNQDGFGGGSSSGGGGSNSGFADDLDDEVPFVTCEPIDNIRRRII